MKLCHSCGVDISHLYRASRRCKPCAADAKRRSGREWAARNYVIREVKEKRCLDCSEVLEHYQAHRCPLCRRRHNDEVSVAWAKRDPDKVKATRDAHKDKYNAHKRAHRHQATETARRRRLEFPEVHRANKAKRRAAKKNATPSWANFGKIVEIYKQAAGEGKHVDHIVPLQHPKVCGLHVEANLQLLTKTENLRKGNKFESDEK